MAVSEASYFFLPLPSQLSWCPWYLGKHNNNRASQWLCVRDEDGMGLTVRGRGREIAVNGICRGEAGSPRRGISMCSEDV